MSENKNINAEKGLLKKAYLASIPIIGWYIVLGMGFGVVLASSGYGLPWALAMSDLFTMKNIDYLLK